MRWVLGIFTDYPHSMFDRSKIIEKAKHSVFWRWVLNKFLMRMVPFNAPHGFVIDAITDDSVRVRIPYRRSNFNHIRGLHACGLATISEYATGFYLISRLDPAAYRLIMKRIEIEYHYQGKMDALAEFKPAEGWFDSSVLQPLKSQEAIVIPCEVRIHDTSGNHLTTALVYWQVKAWSKVKTRA